MLRRPRAAAGGLVAVASAAAILTACGSSGSATGSMAGMSMAPGESMAPGMVMSSARTSAPPSMPVSAPPSMPTSAPPSTRGAASGAGASNPTSVTVGSITLSAAQVKVPVNPGPAGGYLTITNRGSADDLVAAASPDARSVELQTVAADGSAQTTATATHIPIPAKATVAFSPRGLHLTLVQPTGISLRAQIPLLLQFRDAGVITVWARVGG